MSSVSCAAEFARGENKVEEGDKVLGGGQSKVGVLAGCEESKGKRGLYVMFMYDVYVDVMMIVCMVMMLILIIMMLMCIVYSHDVYGCCQSSCHDDDDDDVHC